MDLKAVSDFLDAGGFYFVVIIGLFASLYYMMQIHKEERCQWVEALEKNTNFLRILSERLLLK
jgi:hypothetical protein